MKSEIAQPTDLAPRRSSGVVVTSLIVFIAIASAGISRAVSINVSIVPAGPVAVGDEITVRLGVSGWVAADGEVDSIAFNVDFDTAAFDFVAGSGVALNSGSEFLALPNQGAGYLLFDATSEVATAFGRFAFGAQDNGDASAGSIGPSGPVGSFRLRAKAASPAASVTVQTNDPNQIFGDTNFLGIMPTGGVTLGSTSVTTYDPVTYPSWRAGIAFAVPSDGEPEEDPECDETRNLMEYALDADPLVSDPEKLPATTIVKSGGKNYLALVYVRPTGVATRTDLVYGAERSTDLTGWSDAQVVESTSPGPGPNEETVTVRSTVPYKDDEREFLRIVVTLTP